jgi:TonB family protein
LWVKQFLLFAVCSVYALSGEWCAAAQDAPVQAPALADTPQTGVVLVKLSPPVYPRMAHQAHIAGDVTIQLGIRQDGTLESAEVVSGHPMLKQATLESAQKSRFECRRCNGVTSYAVTYTFAIGEVCHNTPDCSVVAERPSEILQSSSRVVITVDPLCTCDPAVSITPIKWRSAKCLYLWRCGSRVTDVR